MKIDEFHPGDVVFLEHSIAGLPYPTGVYAIWRITEGLVVLSLVSENADGLYGIDNPYTISAEDLEAFTLTSEKARVPGH